MYGVVHLERGCTNHLPIWIDGSAHLKGEMMRSEEEGVNWTEGKDGVRVTESADSQNDKTLLGKNTACRSVVGVECIEPIRKT